MKKVKDKSREVIAFAADVVQSRESADRAGLQDKLVEIAEHLNASFGSKITDFEISRGDSIEALVPSSGKLLSDIVFLLMQETVTMRVIFSKGDVFEPIAKSPALTDGPAWWAARTTLEQIKKRYAHGPVFIGFGEELDKILTGIGQALSQQFHAWTPRQREVVLLRNQLRQNKEVATRLAVTPAVVSKTLTAVNYHTFEDLVEAFLQAIKLATTS